MSPRPYTEEEIRDRFLAEVWSMIRYWAGKDGSNVPEGYDCAQRLSGFAHSLLATVDGGSLGLPGFRLVPDPHPEDKDFHISEGENWYPNDVDIAGGLHELLYADGIRRDRD